MNNPELKAHWFFLGDQIEQFIKNPKLFKKHTPIKAPDGSPIGMDKNDILFQHKVGLLIR